MENVIRRHDERNVSIRNADEYNVFLALRRSKSEECYTTYTTRSQQASTASRRASKSPRTRPRAERERAK